jgi:hypothetical protein
MTKKNDKKMTPQNRNDKKMQKQNDKRMTKINHQQPSEFAGKIFIRLLAPCMPEGPRGPHTTN